MVIAILESVDAESTASELMKSNAPDQAVVAESFDGGPKLAASHLNAHCLQVELCWQPETCQSGWLKGK